MNIYPSPHTVGIKFIWFDYKVRNYFKKSKNLKFVNPCIAANFTLLLQYFMSLTVWQCLFKYLVLCLIKLIDPYFFLPTSQYGSFNMDTKKSTILWFFEKKKP